MSTDHLVVPAGLTAADLDRVRRTVDYLRSHDIDSVLAETLPGLTRAERASVAAHTLLDHAALLVFPNTLDGLRDDLRAEGLRLVSETPSVVVRERLSLRHGVSQDELDVSILKLPVADRRGRTCFLEVFALVAPPDDAIADDERLVEHENHLALRVSGADAVVLNGLRQLLVERGQSIPDGGGYNSHENVTVLYFRGAAGRIELISTGHFSEALAEHAPEPATALLKQMTGAWVTQAIAVAAQLRLADHIDAGLSLARIAEVTGADLDSLARLLRYLTALGLVRTSGTGFTLTETGLLLREHAEGSLHSLALMYGGPFYRSFGRLGDAVRTGTESFQRVFGAHHFDYFAEHPELGALFHRSMAASATIFGQIAEVVDFSGASVVVDVAGGNGELLSRILRADPHLRGVLLDRAGAIESAATTMAAAGCADRCELVVGDFTVAVPSGGDVYVLSRVLHDWTDEQCLTLLRRLAEVMPAHAELLVVERILPEDDRDSLAVAWDIHMLCNVGGRERTEAHYRDLLAQAGFRLTGRHDLRLEASVLQAKITSR